MFWVSNKNIAIILSEKSDGNMRFENNNQTLNAEIKVNRQKFFQKNNINPLKLVNANFAHNNLISVVVEKNLGNGSLNPKTRIDGVDGLITGVKNSYLMITGADCFPVFIYDEQNQIIGIAHCSWKSIMKNIVSEIINKFKKNLNFQPLKLKIWIGPGIKNCHFEIKKDVIKLFKEKYETTITKRSDKYYIDLPAIIKSQLKEFGINSKNIVEHSDCTFCQKEKWFSYRRDKPKYVEAMAFIIGLK
ncbi:peptidoglycan editing factor PgeF [Patescibacteria group bacterium]|nr:peptidoglycan editing factor PgeF [Patescibacteria group bacterium]